MQIRKWILSAAAAAALFAAPGAAPASPSPDRPAEVAQYGQYRRYQAKPTITGMAFLNGKSEFYPGETIQVVLNGTPGGQAFFSIRGVQDDIPMTEVSRGRYQGSLNVQNGMQATNTKLAGRLVVNGRQTQYLAAGGVNVGYAPGSATTYNPTPGLPGYGPGYPGYGPSGYPGYGPSGGYGPYSQAPVGQMFVNVASPQAGQPVPPSFTVTGQTVPGAQVTVSARTQRSLIPGVVNLGSQTANASGVADPNGFFAIPVQLDTGGLGTSNRAVNLKVVATDPRTSQSRQVEYNIATGGY